MIKISGCFVIQSLVFIISNCVVAFFCVIIQRGFENGFNFIWFCCFFGDTFRVVCRTRRRSYNQAVLDVINAHSLTEISFFSSCAVFAMSITSTTRHIIKNADKAVYCVVGCFGLGRRRSARKLSF